MGIVNNNVIFFAEGRLGNQLFQYNLIASKYPNAKIYAIGFQELIDTFDISSNLQNIVIKNNIYKKFVYKIGSKIFDFLAYLRVITSLKITKEIVSNGYSREALKFNHTVGLLNKIIYIKSGYFQSNYFFENQRSFDLEIKKKYREKAKSFIIDNDIDSKYKVFVHIRKGDYSNIYKVYGKSAVLPPSFYKKTIEKFFHLKSNVVFLVFSDDMAYAESIICKITKNYIISQNDYATDISIMRLCQSAILSPSSFSWWGAFMMVDRDLVFAPKNWLGFNSGVNFPNRFPLPSFVTQISVDRNVNK
jgi:hypothetical protein